MQQLEFKSIEKGKCLPLKKKITLRLMKYLHVTRNKNVLNIQVHVFIYWVGKSICHIKSNLQPKISHVSQ